MRTYRNTVLSYSPSAYWPLDEASGATGAEAIGGLSATFNGSEGTNFSRGNQGRINRELSLAWRLISHGEGEVLSSSVLNVTGDMTIAATVHCTHDGRPLK